MGARRSCIYFGALGVGLVLASVLAAAEESAAKPPALERFTLENGLRVWHLQRVENDSVVVVLSMRVGSRCETAENNGISHFLEHMLFAETEKYPEGEVTDVITQRGGVFNGETQYDKTIYYSVTGSHDFATAAEWISQLVFHPTLPADRVERERNVIFQEKGGKSAWYAREMDKHGLGDDVESRMRQILFPQSSLTLPLIGTDRALSRISHENLVAYYQSHYAPNNATLLIVGNVSADAVQKACQDYFASVKTRPMDVAATASVPPAHIPTEPVKMRAPTARRQCSLIVGSRTVTLGHPDWWPLEVLARYLRLGVEKEARLQDGLAYDVEVSNTGYADAGEFSLSTRCDRKHIRDVQAVISHQLDAVRRGEIGEDELKEAKTMLLGQRALALENNMNYAEWLEQLSCFIKDDQPLPDYDSEVENVTAEEVARVANAYMAPGQTATVEHMPLF